MLVAAVLIIPGCGNSSPVAGTWVIEKFEVAGMANASMIGKETVLASDGTVSGFVGEGTYTFADDTVTCKVKKGPAEFEVTMKLVDGKLMVENPGTKITYAKK